MEEPIPEEEEEEAIPEEPIPEEPIPEDPIPKEEPIPGPKPEVGLIKEQILKKEEPIPEEPVVAEPVQPAPAGDAPGTSDCGSLATLLKGQEQMLAQLCLDGLQKAGEDSQTESQLLASCFG